MISINLTIHNKDFLIENVLQGIKDNTESPYELLVVLDGCTDNSEEKTINFLKNTNINYKIFYADNVFETKANNIAAKNSENDYIIIVQDDMIINEKGWDRRLITPLQIYDDVFSVSANCAHDWQYNPNPYLENIIEYSGYSTLLTPKNVVNKKMVPRNEFIIRTTSNRGPLAINHSDLKKLDYFDEIFSPQDGDDHDLHYRAYEKLNKVTGLYWIDFDSEPQWGGTRIHGHQPWLLKSVHKNQKIIINRHKEQILSNREGYSRIIT
jgi:glycosyltransferase involved in cell wall biosynthesis